MASKLSVPADVYQNLKPQSLVRLRLVDGEVVEARLVMRSPTIDGWVVALCENPDRPKLLSRSNFVAVCGRGNKWTS
jgi:hypothetical protein